MLLYFPDMKIIKFDLIPSGNLNYIFHLKSQFNSPKHYPKHPLIDGKVELVGKLNSDEFPLFLSPLFENPTPIKMRGQHISALIDFLPEGSIKLKLLGIGKVKDFAYFFNKTNLLTDEVAMRLKLEYELSKKNMTEKKKIKV